MTSTGTVTYSYSTTDIEIVVRRFTTDLIMIAQSSGAITEAKAREYAHDVEVLATNEYLKQVDVTLLDGLAEVRAAQYRVNTAAGDLVMSRPGSVLWPRVADPDLRVVVSYTKAYTPSAREALRGKLRISWVPVSVDLNHPTLNASGARDYASNGWGLQRKDFN